MKLKKSLLALTTAATVAVAGTTAAVAEEPDNGIKNSSTEPLAGSLKKNQDGTENGNNNEGGDKEEPSKLAGSAANFFGWDEDTKGLEKLTSVVTLVTTIAALVGGIASLVTNIDKLVK